MFAAARRCGSGLVVAMTLAFVVAIVVAIVIAAVDVSVAMAGLVSVVSVVPLAVDRVAVPTAAEYTKLKLLKQSKQKMIKLE